MNFIHLRNQCLLINFQLTTRRLNVHLPLDGIGNFGNTTNYFFNQLCLTNRVVLCFFLIDLSFKTDKISTVLTQIRLQLASTEATGKTVGIFAFGQRHCFYLQATF